ncbi:uncharacterized protein LOC132699390 isoform X3 [Cylas formicarius]|uniref:uncharacterized protein LOC132699390 isoform X3 n=1 Tax=Cylas formicarius TaxID=197179 RepID=UPI0029586B12|nr:uncharacterized protein LOC132699390 isoform X3 [Cylas formicarius]
MNNVSSEKVLTMVLERNIRTLANGVHSPVIGNKSTPIQNPNQGIATLLVMIAVLTIIILFCCFSAPGIRSLCKRYIFRTCPYDDPNLDNVYTRRYGYPTDDLSDVVITDPPKKEHDQVKR